MSRQNKSKSNKKLCTKCQKEKGLNEYFFSNSDLHTDKKYPVCKECLKSVINIDDIETVKDVLMQMNRPFLYDIWITSLDEGQRTGKDAFGMYLKNINLNFKKYSWKDSVFESKNESETNVNIKSSPAINKKEEFIVTDEIIDKWGEGFTVDEYRAFERKYNKLINNYGEKTALHTEGLITYIRFRVKEEMATARGDIREAKEWGQLAAKAAQDAKINVSQLSKSDISGGVDVLSQLFEAVENEVGIIPLLPKIMEQPYDDADLIIWATINYYRRLEEKSPISYREIWNFYDEMLEEYFTSQGFNEEQVQEFKRRRNNVFRDLEQVYREPLYDGESDLYEGADE